MRILLSNDDGIESEGIYALYEEVKDIAEVTVVAPDKERSASGHSVTIFDPLRAVKVYKNGKFFGYSINGTPADSVKIGIKAIMEERPNLVISGINMGPNMGTNVIYSGTVSAAAEGMILGVPSFAISLDTFRDPNYKPAAKFAKKMALEIEKRGLPRGVILNINVPNLPESEIRGVKITRQGASQFFEEFYEKRTDPAGRTYYWLAGELVTIEEDENVDATAVKNGYISVTPIHYDLTDYSFIEELKGWGLSAP
ncbi:MAG: 5'/3'-nucleotidase SurE [bacterium]